MEKRFFAFKTGLIETVTNSLDEKGKKWLDRILGELEIDFNDKNFFMSYSATPRFTGKTRITLFNDSLNNVLEFTPPWEPGPWTIDEAVRILLLIYLPSKDESKYIKTITDLSNAADASELRSIFLALPFLSYPERWTSKTAEGIRSNIKEAFEAIALNNPYPSNYLSDNAWNQMVLKTIFTGSSISKIYDFDKRRNEELARMLVDFAHERWAAGREVSPELWRGVTPFLNDSLIPDFNKLFDSQNILEREAAALVCSSTETLAFQDLLDQHPLLKSEIATGQINWDKIAKSYKL